MVAFWRFRILSLRRAASLILPDTPVEFVGFEAHLFSNLPENRDKLPVVKVPTYGIPHEVVEM